MRGFDAHLLFQIFVTTLLCPPTILGLTCSHLGVYSDLCPTSDICDLQKERLQLVYTGKLCLLVFAHSHALASRKLGEFGIAIAVGRHTRPVGTVSARFASDLCHARAASARACADV